MASLDVSALLKDVKIEVKIEGVAQIDSDKDKELGKELGRGAYGRVFTVKYCRLVCAAKEIHSILIEGVSPAEKKTIVDNFIRECHHCSVIRHPNIVQFLGIYYSSEKCNPLEDPPIMIMELMDTSLTSFVKNNHSNIPVSTKMSILYDVSLALTFLHTRKPVVIHRDLSPNNVMLTSHLMAKIGDLGVAKVVRADNRQTKGKLTKAPGTLHFMPPEALVEDNPGPVYGTPVDVFSFGGIVLHVFSEEWPTPGAPKVEDPVTEELIALSEAKRRQKYLDKLTGRAAGLRVIVERCLHDNPKRRPKIEEVFDIVETSKVRTILQFAV